MKLDPKLVAALRRIPNKVDFAKRYDIAPRTIYNCLDPEHGANRSTVLMLTMALQAEGLLEAPGTKKARVHK